MSPLRQRLLWFGFIAVCGAAVAISAGSATRLVLAPRGQLPEGAVMIRPGGYRLQKLDEDCGIAALARLLELGGTPVSYEQLYGSARVSKRGVTMQELARLARVAEVELKGYHYANNSQMPSSPSIARLALGDKGHYVVVERVTLNGLIIFDPSLGWLQYERGAFARAWSGHLLVPSGE